MERYDIIDPMIPLFWDASSREVSAALDYYAAVDACMHAWTARNRDRNLLKVDFTRFLRKISEPADRTGRTLAVGGQLRVLSRVVFVPLIELICI